MKKFSFLCLGWLLVQIHGTGSDWETLAPGLELARFNSNSKAGIMYVIRVDSYFWDFDVLCRDELNLNENLSVKGWCQKYKLTVAINAGMYGKDFKTHIGYLKKGDYINNARINHYQSVLAFGPLKKGIPYVRIFDLDRPEISFEWLKTRYHNLVQNLRLIKHSRENRWPRQDQRWREAALAEDNKGRILFILCLESMTMKEFNQRLLDSDIGIVTAQHLEGGHEAQLHVDWPGIDWGQVEKNSWPIPNIIAVKPKKK